MLLDWLVDWVGRSLHSILRWEPALAELRGHFQVRNVTLGLPSWVTASSAVSGQNSFQDQQRTFIIYKHEILYKSWNVELIKRESSPIKSWKYKVQNMKCSTGEIEEWRISCSLHLSTSGCESNHQICEITSPNISAWTTPCSTLDMSHLQHIRQHDVRSREHLNCNHQLPPAWVVSGCWGQIKSLERMTQQSGSELELRRSPVFAH